MHWRAIIRLFGILLVLYSLNFLPSIGIAYYYGDGQEGIFYISFLLTLAAGGLLWLPNWHAHQELSVRDGFLVVTLFWVLLGVVGALPFMVGLHWNLTDAVFESISGFTTTGATVIASGIDQLPPSIQYHRQQLNFLGGMGIVVLAVAVLPMLGVGGMQLYRAETSGVTKNEKLTPRIAETARSLWLVYFALTAACALAFWAAGMSLFDAIGHSYAAVGTGGFSTHDASFGHWNSPLIEGIAIFFMLAGGANFAVHFLAWQRRSLWPLVRDSEVRAYGLIFLFSSLFVAATLALTGTYDNGWQALRHGAFQVASILTSTGFTTAVFADWPLYLPLVLVTLSFIGGCAGSTAGGIKVVRIQLLGKLGLRQLFLLAHPQAISHIKLGRRPISDQILFSVWGFYVLYISSTLLLTIAMMGAGLDFVSAFGAVQATINLCGPGLGKVAVTFAEVNDTVKWLGSFAMLLGRLEIFTLLILFLPAYWRH
ncbi:MAG: potassium transporter [Chromatiaceae bacterium]|nr:potassium transporter [Chromatiaceae bacterium]MBP8024278.1 potassium transporter [Chromatiaceae bacterium]